MSPEPVIEPNPERLTIEEIEKRYPNQWVLIIDYEFEFPRMKLTTGIVYARGPSRQGLRPIARGFRSCCIHWTGELKNFKRPFRHGPVLAPSEPGRNAK